jgi:hypothetical protein
MILRFVNMAERELRAHHQRGFAKLLIQLLRHVIHCAPAFLMRPPTKRRMSKVNLSFRWLLRADAENCAPLDEALCRVKSRPTSSGMNTRHSPQSNTSHSPANEENKFLIRPSAFIEFRRDKSAQLM